MVKQNRYYDRNSKINWHRTTDRQNKINKTIDTTQIKINLFMTEDIEDIEIAFRKLQQALLADSEEQWDKIINNKSKLKSNIETPDRIYIRVCGEIVIDRHSPTFNAIEYLVATYDNANIRITIDASKNHVRGHIHIGIREDKYHSASIAIDDGTILNNSGNIADWKVRKITDWVLENRQILEKIYRCINAWGDTVNADKRKNKLPDIE